MTTRRNHLTGPMIHSPNPLVFTITVNEFNGHIRSHSNRPTPHLQAIVILSKVIVAQVEDSLRMSGKSLATEKGFNAIVTLAELMEGIVRGTVAQAQGNVTVPENPSETPSPNPSETPAKPEDVN